MIKRIFDFFVASVCLVFLSPVLAVIALLVRFFIGRNVFFIQSRPGKNGVPFEILKFRTMSDERDDDGNLLGDEVRLLNFGKFLRSCSLDELPGIYNVFKGDMSLVGPRPLLVEYLPLYTEFQRRRHEVRPGITGWAQVNGRNAISWEEKFKLDVWYVDNQSLLLDIKILLLTLRKVFARQGISAAGEATMAKFTGSRANK